MPLGQGVLHWPRLEGIYVMAHPDDGYLIPDDKWGGMVDPETGENFYPEDRYASYRLELIRLQQDFPKGIMRGGPEYEQRLRRLEKLRNDALGTRPKDGHAAR